MNTIVDFVTFAVVPVTDQLSVEKETVEVEAHQPLLWWSHGPGPSHQPQKPPHTHLHPFHTVPSKNELFQKYCKNLNFKYFDRLNFLTQLGSLCTEEKQVVGENVPVFVPERFKEQNEKWSWLPPTELKKKRLVVRVMMMISSPLQSKSPLTYDALI